MLTATDRLVLIGVKVERAKKHLEEMESEVASFRRQNMHVIGPHYDAETGKSRLDLKPLPILPFNVVATAGDVIQNLRSALDHLAHHLAEVGLLGGEPDHDVSFPIAKSAEIYQAIRPRRTQGMRPEAVEAIDKLTPYKGGCEPLWTIHELNNLDKHRFLITVGYDHLFTGPGFEGGFWLQASSPIFERIIEGIAEPIPLEGGALPIEKAFDEKASVKTDALIPTLRHLVAFVDNLIPKFKANLE